MMLDFYKGKRVLITGHTGFKGSWLSKILVMAGADVHGYALPQPEDNESLYKIADIENIMDSHLGDIRNYDELKEYFDKVRPEIVFHLAAQPIVRDSYKDPRYTYETNVMGTVNICECVRLSGSVKSFLNVTTDKVYQNNEWEWGYREDEKLDGFDPYSNSKSCSELVTHSYINSFLNEMGVATSTARAGNVIGGGDFANDRLIPDCVRATMKGEKIILRNPDSTRPFQHVLEALSAYLFLAQMQYEDKAYAGYYNVGPNEGDAVTAGKLAGSYADVWNELIAAGEKNCKYPNKLEIEVRPDGGPHEANYLKLDCSKIKSRLKWSPKWNIDDAVRATAEWTYAYFSGEGIASMEKQIKEYFQ
nr:CDP-glucose 4,6-dehydratase [Butyrivibrio sp. XB500-5]